MSVGQIETETLTTSISVPSEMGGPGIGTNPEHLLIGAASSCYLITLAAILTNRKLPYIRIDLETVGTVINDRGLRFDAMEHRPTIVVGADMGADMDIDVYAERIATLADHAEHACMVSSALRGNVTISVVPRVVRENRSTPLT